jgi:hypothetical protein
VEERITDYAYDKFNRVIRITDGDEKTTVFSNGYDAFGRKVFTSHIDRGKEWHESSSVYAIYEGLSFDIALEYAPRVIKKTTTLK